MFERFTERARRVLFFARYEALQLGSVSIESEHLLLGLVREGKGMTSRIFADAGVSLEGIARTIRERAELREKLPTSAEIPFSATSRRVLQYTADEADRLGHEYIGTEHLLLGLLREEGSMAATLLQQHGLGLAAARDRVEALAQERRQLGRVPAGVPHVSSSDPDARAYAIKRTQRPALVTAEIVEIVVGKYAAFTRVMQHDASMTDADRQAGWEYFFEPAGDSGATA